MAVPDGFVTIGEGRRRGLARADLVGVPLAAWWQSGRPLADAAGRGTVAVLEIEGLRLVARDYRRGGVLRGLLPDRFRSADRAFDELALLDRLRGAGVRCVEPVAAVVQRHGALWALRLVTVLVDGARTLPAFAREHPGLRAETVAAAGRVVGAAFAAGLHHPDLHPDNLLARVAASGSVDVWLLDLDRATLGAPPTVGDRGAMLVRMARYLVKHRARLGVTLTARDALHFLRGAGLDGAELRRLRPLFERSIRRRTRRYAIRG